MTHGVTNNSEYSLSSRMEGVFMPLSRSDVQGARRRLGYVEGYTEHPRGGYCFRGWVPGPCAAGRTRALPAPVVVASMEASHAQSRSDAAWAGMAPEVRAGVTTIQAAVDDPPTHPDMQSKASLRNKPNEEATKKEKGRKLLEPAAVDKSKNGGVVKSNTII